MNANDILEIREPKRFIEDAENFVKELNKDKYGKLRKNISTSQLRKIYDAIICVKNYDSAELYLIKPKLAYLRGRNQIPKNFVDKINGLIDSIEKKEHLVNFQKYMGAVVAYNKEYGKD